MYNILIYNKVTILILIDGFLQWRENMYITEEILSHNPYFNRWFSAIKKSHIKILQMEKSQSLF